MHQSPPTQKRKRASGGEESQGTTQAVGEPLAHVATCAPCWMRIGVASRYVGSDAKHGQAVSTVWRICAEQQDLGSREGQKLGPRLGLVVVLAAAPATSQPEHLLLAAIRRRAAELSNGASAWLPLSGRPCQISGRLADEEDIEDAHASEEKAAEAEARSSKHCQASCKPRRRACRSRPRQAGALLFHTSGVPRAVDCG
jgi:hypothetical protein